MFRIASACGIALSGLATNAALAQSYPAKPLRFIVGFAPGGAPDTMTRLFADRLPVALGQPIVVENRPAAGGLVAAENVSKAPPDGYVLLSTVFVHGECVVRSRPGEERPLRSGQRLRRHHAATSASAARQALT